MTNSTSLLDLIRSLLKSKPDPEPDDGAYCLFGDHERYSLHSTVKRPYYVRNTDEAGTPLDQSYWDEKWSTHDKASCANAADFDALCLAYGADAAKDLWAQMSHPVSGHAVNIKSIESTEASDFDALCNNQEKNLAELEENYRAYARIKNSWF
jgi:hypothetical protein